MVQLDVQNGWEENTHMVVCQGSTRAELTTLRFTGPVPADDRQ